MLDLRREKILVTGAHGFLGEHLLARLAAAGVPEGQISAPRSADLDLRLRENCVRAVAGQSVVIHLAGITGDAEFHRDHPGEIFYENLVMGMELMEAARRAGVKKFVTIGSVTEYPEAAPLPFREDNLWIGPVEPLHEGYTIAKKMLGVQAAAYRSQYGFSAIHLLMTNMYGPGREPRGGFVVTNIIKRIIEAKKSGASRIEVWGTGAATRDFLYVEDAALGIIRAAERYDAAEPVNLGSGWEISIKELVGLIADIMDFRGEIFWNTQKPDGVPRRMLDTTRAEREFGFRPTTSFADGLKKTIAWHETNTP